MARQNAASSRAVIPAQAGIQFFNRSNLAYKLDPGLRWDGNI
jgi:hypothetical protein